MDQSEINKRFNYHKPDALKASRHETIRIYCREMASSIDSVITEESREKSLAITKLEEVMFWANAAIAREGK